MAQYISSNISNQQQQLDRRSNNNNSDSVSDTAFVTGGGNGPLVINSECAAEVDDTNAEAFNADDASLATGNLSLEPSILTSNSSLALGRLLAEMDRLESLSPPSSEDGFLRMEMLDFRDSSRVRALPPTEETAQLLQELAMDQFFDLSAAPLVPSTWVTRILNKAMEADIDVSLDVHMIAWMGNGVHAFETQVDPGSHDRSSFYHEMDASWFSAAGISVLRNLLDPRSIGEYNHWNHLFAGLLVLPGVVSGGCESVTNASKSQRFLYPHRNVRRK